jgi:glucose-1-phosphate thymidylyltransferase
MKIVIPMAGRGTRLRPHTLITPKPLLKINGKTIVERLIEKLTESFDETIDEIAFVIGDFGKSVEDQLQQIAADNGADSKIYYQDRPLGTAHAVFCAADSLQGPVVVAFADTLFYSEFTISPESESVIWTKRVANPESFGVVTSDSQNCVTDFVEKPETFVSDQAIIGIYYFKNGQLLKDALCNLIDNKQTVAGEYQLTDALQTLKDNGTVFNVQDVSEWLDCGNSSALLDTTEIIFDNEGHFVSDEAIIKDSMIHQPCHIQAGAVIENSIIGPYVTVENNTEIDSSVITSSILREFSIISNSVLSRSIVGKHAEVIKKPKIYDIGSYTKIN